MICEFLDIRFAAGEKLILFVIMSEMHHVGGVDPSNLHLKKELTQIRKASRVLRDLGTTSSWRSPLSSSRSLAANGSTANHYYHHRRIESNGDQVLEESSAQIPSKAENNSNGKDKRVFLYNWRSTQKSESERSVNGGSSLVLEESVDDSLSDARNNGDAAAVDRYASVAAAVGESRRKRWMASRRR